MADLEIEVDDLDPQHVSFRERRKSSVCDMSDIFGEAAMELEIMSPSNKKPENVSEEMNEETQAMFNSLESLAEAASKLILAGQVEEALQILEQAFSSVKAEEDVEIALAGVGVQILLCAGLSQASRHEEALEIAQHAVQSADAVLEQLEEPDEEMADAEDEMEGSKDLEAPAFEEPATAPALPYVPLALLQRALESAVQSRQCQALEMEFLGPRCKEIGLDFWQKLMGLQDECLELAQGLPHSSKVRQRAEQGKREWQLRAADATLPKLSPGCSGALQAWRCMLGAPRKAAPRSTEGLHLPRHERLYQGIPPLVDLDFERWRRRPSYQMEPSTPSSTYMEKGRGSISAQTLGSWSTSSSLASTGMKSTSRHQLPRGDLYVNTSPRRGELPRTPNWTSARRVPVLFSIQGTEGKSSWALRTVRKRDRVVFDDKKMNAFEDWRKNGSGPKMRLRDQVLQTEKGMQYFHDNLKKQSYRFKNFWLKDMVTQDDLYEDRTVYCSEGLRVLKKNPRKQLRPSSPMNPQAKKLFDHYGISCPNISEPSTLHLQVNSYSELLQKSQHQAKLDRLPWDKGNSKRRRFSNMGHLDALRVILRKHRRTAVSGHAGLPGLEVKATRSS